MTRNEASGIIVLDKAPGITSFQALGGMKKSLQTGRLGHTGTLDRFASGVLVVFAGNMTRLVPYFQDGGKEYEATFEFGRETATLDPEGGTVATSGIPSRDAVETGLSAFRGDIMQSPPSYSAVHVAGKRAYERVLSGETVELEPRKVRINRFELLAWNPPFGNFLIECSKGTYVRSLARDLAIASGARAYVSALRRRRNGPFTETDAVSAANFLRERDLRQLTPEIMERAGIPSVTLEAARKNDFASGKPLGQYRFSGAVPQGICAVFGETGDLWGMIRNDGGTYGYESVFVSRS